MPNWFLKALEEWLWLLRLDGPPVDRWTSALAQRVRRFSYPKIMNKIYGCGADCLSETLREDPTGSSAHRLPGNLLYGRLVDGRRRCPLRGI